MKKAKISFRLQLIYRKHLGYAQQIIDDGNVKFVSATYDEDEDEDDNMSSIVFEISYKDEIQLAKQCVGICAAFNAICSEEHGEAGEACYVNGVVK